MPDGTAIRVLNLSKKYNLYRNRKERLKEALHPFRRKYHKDFWALRNINLEVEKGQILGVVGRNGSGKSTLLKIISRVTAPTSGHVVSAGRLVALLELGSGFNPQFTGLENIYFLGSINGFSRTEVDGMVDGIVEFADIGEHISQPIKTYSSGMKTRLAFAVSTAIDPEILILDEVLAVGDDLFKRKCFARMEKMMGEGTTVIYVSHSIASINQMCGKAILLEKGELLLEGPAKMVTMYYQKMLYSRKEMRGAVLAEIAEAHGNKENHAAFLPARKETPGDDVAFERGEPVEALPLPVEEKAEAVAGPYYVSEFKPASTMEYRNFEVDIFDFSLKTPDGKEVNHLLAGEEYVYEYKVFFGLDVTDVSFGMQVRTEKGLPLMAVNSLELENRRINAKRGTTYRVRYYLKMNLIHGTYYLTAGTSCQENDERVVLNRVVDAHCFKVVKIRPGPTGIVFMSPRLETSLVDASAGEAAQARPGNKR